MISFIKPSNFVFYCFIFWVRKKSGQTWEPVKRVVSSGPTKETPPWGRRTNKNRSYFYCQTNFSQILINSIYNALLIVFQPDLCSSSLHDVETYWRGAWVVSFIRAMTFAQASLARPIFAPPKAVKRNHVSWDPDQGEGAICASNGRSRDGRSCERHSTIIKLTPWLKNGIMW